MRVICAIVLLRVATCGPGRRNILCRSALQIHPTRGWSTPHTHIINLPWPRWQRHLRHRHIEPVPFPLPSSSPSPYSVPLEKPPYIVDSRRQSEVLSPPLFLLPKIQLKKPTFSTSGSWSPGSASSSTLRSPIRIRFLYSAGVSMSVPPRHMPRRATLTGHSK